MPAPASLPAASPGVLHVVGGVYVFVVTHAPPVHPLPAGHLVPHVPQLSLSAFLSTHCPLHAVSVPKQAVVVVLMHLPLEHVDVGAEQMVPASAAPHPPQLVMSATVLMHLPLQ